MGNEGSVPQSGEEEFEQQATEPPSAIHPPAQSAASASAPQIASASGQPQSRGGRMMNAVFHRRQNNNASASTQGGYRNQAGAPPMQAEDMVMMSPEQQQQYYHEQQDMYLQQQQYYNHQAYPGATEGTFPSHPQGAAPASAAPAGSNPSPPKKGMGFRPSGRPGAALINSMKNLSIGTGVLNRGQGNAASAKSPAHSTTKEWETKWDEDDSDEDEIPEKPPAHPSAHNAGQLQPDPMVMPPMVRPGMDVGLSSPPPTSIIPPMTPADPQTKAHLVTATPDHPGVVEDGVEWDTGVVPPESLDYEKPNVQMFLPLLRVLGKGSFGKGDNPDLDAATANFDNTFTRMPVETDDHPEANNDQEHLEELHEDTFIGFTFDDKDREDGPEATQPQAEPQRQRTHHYTSGDPNQEGAVHQTQPATGHQID
eukprot:Nitzschia sp. Nitz4//scaffold1_size375055//207372//209583//NITZ4_000283-RA/size375055-augustus-gene-0.679-mRNA-1//1//CDS//3329541066//1253//frame0